MINVKCTCKVGGTFTSLFRTKYNRLRNKCNPRIQVSNGTLWKYFCIKVICFCVKDNHRNNLQASNCGKEYQLTGKSYKKQKTTLTSFLKTNGENAKHSCFLPH